MNKLEKKLGPEIQRKPTELDLLTPANIAEPLTKNIFAKKLLNKKNNVNVKEERKQLEAQNEPEEPQIAVAQRFNDTRLKKIQSNVEKPMLSLNIDEANAEAYPAEEDCMAEDFEGENIRNEPANQKQTSAAQGKTSALASAFPYLLSPNNSKSIMLERK